MNKLSSEAYRIIKAVDVRKELLFDETISNDILADVLEELIGKFAFFIDTQEGTKRITAYQQFYKFLCKAENLIYKTQWTCTRSGFKRIHHRCI